MYSLGKYRYKNGKIYIIRKFWFDKCIDEGPWSANAGKKLVKTLVNTQDDVKLRNIDNIIEKRLKSSDIFDVIVPRTLLKNFKRLIFNKGLICIDAKIENLGDICMVVGRSYLNNEDFITFEEER